MKAVILCAGDGERLRPITETIPKTLIPVARVSILARIFAALPECVSEVILVIQEKHEQAFHDFLDTHPLRVSVTYVFQDMSQKGTYHALMAAKEHVGNEKKFLVLNGDDVVRKSDLSTLCDMPAPAYGLAWKESNPKYRTCDVSPQTGLITSFRKITDYEIDSEVLFFTGAYTLSRDFFDYPVVYTESGEGSIPDTLFSARTPVGYSIFSRWIQINTHEDLASAEKYFIENPA